MITPKKSRTDEQKKRMKEAQANPATKMIQIQKRAEYHRKKRKLIAEWKGLTLEEYEEKKPTIQRGLSAEFRETFGLRKAWTIDEYVEASSKPSL